MAWDLVSTGKLYVLPLWLLYICYEFNKKGKQSKESVNVSALSRQVSFIYKYQANI